MSFCERKIYFQKEGLFNENRIREENVKINAKYVISKLYLNKFCNGHTDKPKAICPFNFS